MRTRYSKFVFSLIAFFVISLTASAQFVVKVRPPAPVIKVRPVCPGPRHVWVGGEYTWRGGQYVYTDGFWSEPPRHRAHWVEGRWKHSRRGWIWVPGHWK